MVHAGNYTSYQQHPTITAASSSDNSVRTYVQDILLDSNGHVTGITTATETVVNTDTDTNDIDYINAASFNTSTGVLSLTGVGNAGATVDLDGRYLLDTTDTFTGALTIAGDIRGNGQQLILNAGESYAYATGQTNEYVYINAEQGLEVNSETNNWTVNGWSDRKTALLRGDLLRLDGEDLTKTNIQNFKTAYGWGDHSTVGYLTGYTDTNDIDYINAATFNTGTGVITGTGTGNAGFTVDIDGRYLQLSGGNMTGNIVFNDDGEGIEFYSTNSLKKIAGSGMVLEVDPSRTDNLVLPIKRGSTYD